MARMNFEISEDERRYIKMMAAMDGVSIKEYIRNRLIPTPSDETAAAMKDAEDGNLTSYETADEMWGELDEYADQDAEGNDE